MQLSRSGSKIDWLSVDGIRIGDSRDLLSPGASLDSIAKTMRLPVCKMKFPFSFLSSYSRLDHPCLPTRLEDWHNVLNPSASATASDIREAVADYDRLGCTSLRAYLVEYLVSL